MLLFVAHVDNSLVLTINSHNTRYRQRGYRPPTRTRPQPRHKNVRSNPDKYGLFQLVCAMTPLPRHQSPSHTAAT